MRELSRVEGIVKQFQVVSATWMIAFGSCVIDALLPEKDTQRAVL
jgi:hypothetical protein